MPALRGTVRFAILALSLLTWPVAGAAQLLVHGPSPSMLFRYGHVEAARLGC
jgi:hypothetical protein